MRISNTLELTSSHLSGRGIGLGSGFGKGSQFSWERGQLARGAATRAGRPRSQARELPQV